MKNQTEVRESFWLDHPDFRPLYRKSKRQNEYDVDIRCAFVDYVDALHRDGVISDKLAQRVTL